MDKETTLALTAILNGLCRSDTPSVRAAGQRASIGLMESRLVKRVYPHQFYTREWFYQHTDGSCFAFDNEHVQGNMASPLDGASQ